MTDSIDASSVEPGQSLSKALVEDRLDWSERLSDRVSPILVREIQQALKGKMFLATLFASVTAIIIIAFVVLVQGDQSPRAGSETFVWCLIALAPIILFVVPQQAYLSMRHEVSEGTAEQLILTRLSPLRIVTGKIAAAMMQFLLFLAVFSPVMALTFLLRGVDVPTIGLILLFAALASLTATTFAIAIAALGRLKLFSQVIVILVTAALGMATASAMGGAPELVRLVPRLLRGPDFWSVMASVVLGFAAGMTLFVMMASAALAHTYENRSTQFRLFAVGLLITAGIMVVAVVDTRFLDTVGPGLAGFSALFGLPFYLWASCETESLSPRVAENLPRRPWLRALAIPFLPGGGRGLIFTWFFAAFSLSLGWGIAYSIAGKVDEEVMGVACVGWGYALIYTTYGRLLRSRFADSQHRSILVVLLVVLSALAAMLVPFLIQTLLSMPSSDWNAMHLLSVPRTMFYYANNSEPVSVPLAVWAGALVVGSFGIGAMLRGVAEVKTCANVSAERRLLASRVSDDVGEDSDAI